MTGSTFGPIPREMVDACPGARDALEKIVAILMRPEGERQKERRPRPEKETGK